MSALAMRLSFCLVPVTIAALLAGCAQSPLVDNIASSNKRLDPWLPPLPTPVPAFRANDWSLPPQTAAAPVAQRPAAAPAPVSVAAPAPAPAPVAPLATALTSEPVKWMRQSNSCESNEHCAEVSVEYPRFAQDTALTKSIERQLGAVLTGLTQPQLIQPAVTSDSYTVEASVERYLNDSYSEGFVELSADVLRADSQVAVFAVNGTLHRAARDTSETQYLLYDRTRERLVDQTELAQSGALSRHVAQLLREGAPSENLSRAAGALLSEDAIEGDN